jgi:hypothetical protein
MQNKYYLLINQLILNKNLQRLDRYLVVGGGVTSIKVEVTPAAAK